MLTVLGIDAGSRTAADAEHLLLAVAADLGAGPGAVLCTHAVRQGTPHYAGTLTLPTRIVLPDVPDAGLALLGADPGTALVGAVAVDQHLVVGTVPGHAPVAAGVLTAGDPALVRTALSAATDRAAGEDGRAVRFPGADLLTGTVPIADVLENTAIEELRVLGGGALPPDAVLHTRDFCRPVYAEGRLVLHLLPAGRGAVAPFEVPNPTPCCAAHS